jgi:acyl-CoA thioesterase-1
MLKRFFISLCGLNLVACLLAFSGTTYAEAAIANPKILIYGDSLSAAYGIPQQSGWPALLQKKLLVEGYRYDIVNASISGETTSGGLSRLKKTLETAKPAIIILELGANDGLRGLPINAMASNLTAMIEQMQKTKAQIILAGMKIPPNYGPQYTNGFANTYEQLSKKYGLKLVPFLLDQVAAQQHLLLQDGLHPNAEGQVIMLNNIWPHLKPLLKKRT